MYVCTSSVTGVFVSQFSAMHLHCDHPSFEEQHPSILSSEWLQLRKEALWYLDKQLEVCCISWNVAVVAGGREKEPERRAKKVPCVYTFSGHHKLVKKLEILLYDKKYYSSS